jgi:iron complex outermembrane receptor protein
VAEQNLVRDSVRRALAVSLASSLVAGTSMPVLAQDDIAIQEKVTVTGSRIKRVDIEGPSPISIISREDIDASGMLSLESVLRSSTYNSFGSFKQRSGSSSQSQAGISLRGLGSQRTLVLMDGRRITGSPTNGAGSTANLNTIPLAAVERIEILREGASAVYGSDAIGGVVNIILRSDYEGMQLTYDIGRPTQTGGDEESYSIVGGVSGAKGNITFGFSADQKDIIYNADRSYSATGLSSFGFPASYFAYLTTNDLRNPTGDYLSVGLFADPRCPENLNTDPLFPDSEVQFFGSPDNQGRCRYNYAGVAANESEMDRKSFFLNTEYEINETTSFFARGTFTFNESFGRYAAAPSVPFPLMDQGNPNNPTAPGVTNTDGQPFSGQSVDTDGDGAADLDGPFDLSLFYRNTPGGFRNSNVEDTLVDYLAGVQGTVDWLGGADWELAGQWSQQTVSDHGSGFGLLSPFETGVDSGTIDVYAVNTPFGPDQVALQKATAMTTTANSRTRVATVNGQLNFDAFQMKNGAVPVALGFEYRDDDFDENFDEQSNAGNVIGSSASPDTSGARTVKSLFAETSVPLLSGLETRIAVRYDDYNDFGTTVNPQLAAAYRPIDSLLLRSSWGNGFRAPNMAELYASPFTGTSGSIDTTRCAADPLGDPNTGRSPIPFDELPFGNPCRSVDYLENGGGNRDLEAETSSQWGAGFVWSPLDDLSLSFDWYDIEIEDQISTPDPQQHFDDEFRLRQAGATGNTVGNVTRRNSGRAESVDNFTTNFASTETDGFDVEVSYGFSFTRIGDFRTNLQWTHVNEYERDFGDGQGKQDPLVFDPENRATLGLNWALGDFSANVIGNYISSSSIFFDETFVLQLDDMTTWDVQLGYATPWNGMVTIGARNIFDEDPPTSTQLGNPYYSNQLHDVYGRVPYLRYQQDL